MTPQQPRPTVPEAGPQPVEGSGPLTNEEVQTYRIAYGIEIDLMREVERFTHHRTVPGKGYQCSCNPCRCGLTALLDGLEGRKRVTPPAPLNAWEQRQRDRKRVAR